MKKLCVTSMFVLVLSSCGVEENSSLDSQILKTQQDEFIRDYTQDFFQKQLRGVYNFANMIGYGWAYGCPFYSGWEGDRFVIRQERFSKERCNKDGYRNNDRTAYTLYDFRSDLYDIDIAKAQSKGAPNIQSVQVLTIKNYGTNPASASVSYNGSKRSVLTTNSSTVVGGSFTTTVSNSVEVGLKAGLLGFGGETKYTASISFAGEVSKSITEGSSSAQWEGDSFGFDTSIQVPGCSEQEVELVVTAQDYVQKWQAKVKTYSKIEMHGFLRWGFHAHRDYGDNRPTVATTFGGEGLSIGEAIASEVANNHRYWDWNKVRNRFSSFDTWVNYLKYQRPMQTSIQGEMLLREQLHVSARVGKEKPLNPSQCVSGTGPVEKTIAK